MAEKNSKASDLAANKSENKMKRNEIGIGAVLSYVQQFANLLIGLVYTPVMIRLLGKGEYGLYATVASITAMLTVLSMGFGNSYIRYFAKYRESDDQTKLSDLNGMFLTIFVVIALIAGFCGGFLICNLHLVFDEGFSQQEYAVARVLLMILVIQLMISFPMSVFANIINAHEKFIFSKIVGLLKTIAGPLVTLPLLLAGGN